MSRKIRVISETLANKIAAGEVVERPASVVKELVENSLDAGATQITIDIRTGGRRSIKVIDDGEGMDRDDALLALERHATSKIYKEEDLFRINTMGFRGEALPSIASVSKMRITTKPSGSLAGVSLYCDAGKIKEVSEAGCPIGTIIEVNSLFYNTPARLKFMKTETTEFGHIADLVTQIALANPDTHFKLIHNSKVMVNAPIIKELSNRVVELLGRDVYENLYEVLLEGEAVKVRGLISQPNFTRSTSKSIYTYVNRRFIRDRVVQHAIMEAYRTFIMKNRYPSVILFIDLPAQCVDVNVHPTKRQVRFKEQQKVHDFVVEALLTTLKKSPWIMEGLVSFEEKPPADTRIEDHHRGIAEAVSRYSVSKKDISPPDELPVSREKPGLPIQMKLFKEQPLFFSSLIPIGQVKDTYILCSCAEGLIIIDQHAAHERVIFETLKEGYSKTKVISQGLLVPQQIELSYREARSLEGYLSRLLELGLEIEPFGGDTFIVKSIPQILINKDYSQLILDIVDDLNSYGNSLKFEELKEKILILMACHGAIKANQHLNKPEIEALLQQLDRVGSPTNCPHGRPILRRITCQELDRMFKRG